MYEVDFINKNLIFRAPIRRPNFYFKVSIFLFHNLCFAAKAKKFLALSHVSKNFFILEKELYKRFIVVLIARSEIETLIHATFARILMNNNFFISSHSCFPNYRRINVFFKCCKIIGVVS